MTYEQAIAFLKTKTPLRISVGGDIGSGKSTFSKHLAEELNIPRIYIGQFMREEAKSRNMTLDAFNALLEEDDEIDRLMDQKTHETSKKEERGIFEGRVAWHFVEKPDAKVYFSVDAKVAAQRIWEEKDNHLRDQYESVDALMKANKARKQSEEARYHSYYAISAYEKKNYDVVTDTTESSIQQVFEETVIAIAEFVQEKSAQVS